MRILALLPMLAGLPLAHADDDVEKLTERLKSARGHEQRQIAAALARTQDKDALPPLLSLFRYRTAGTDDSVAVAQALGVFGDKRAVGPLLEAWDYTGSLKLGGGMTPGHQLLRATVIEAFGRIKDKRTRGIVLEALSDEDAVVAQRAVEAAGRMKERQAVEILLVLIRRRDIVGQAAYEALGEIGDKRAGPALLRGMEGSDPFVKAQAAYALARMGDRSGMKTLRGLVAEPTFGRAALLAAYYLARLEDKTGTEYLLDVVHGKGRMFVESAVDYLARAGNRKAVNPLAESLERSKDPVLRLRCVYILRELGGSKAVHALHRVIDDKDKNVASAARKALTDMGEYD